MTGEDQQKAIFKDEATQKTLNAPLAADGEMEAADRQFLDLVLGLLEKGELDLYKAETLLNKAVYEELDQAAQGKADLEAVNILSALRDIKDLHDAGFTETYQMKNLVSRVRQTKERLEEAGGDLFII